MHAVHDAILFDLDGVLVDSRTPIARSINASLEAHGLPARPEPELYPLIGPPMHDSFRLLSGLHDVDSFVAFYRERYRTHMDAETTVQPGIPELLDTLDLPCVVATSKPKALAEPLLDAVGLRHHFLAVEGPSLAADGESKATTIGRALEALHEGAVPVMVGDRMHDVLGAAAHGLACIGVLWGIGTAEELMQAGAVAITGTPAELRAFL
jgi:phosphoglycolate phosphatase